MAVGSAAGGCGAGEEAPLVAARVTLAPAPISWSFMRDSTRAPPSLARSGLSQQECHDSVINIKFANIY